MSDPYERRMDELRHAYMDVPAGYPADRDLAQSMPRLLEAVSSLLRETGRLCEVCAADHSKSLQGDIEHEDFGLILNALGLGDHARPISRHAIVHQEILPAIQRLVLR